MRYRTIAVSLNALVSLGVRTSSRFRPERREGEDDRRRRDSAECIWDTFPPSFWSSASEAFA